jgi:hypothetical protein
MAGAMEKIKAKVENVLHKDKDTTHDTTHTGTTGTHTTGSGLTGSTHSKFLLFASKPSDNNNSQMTPRVLTAHTLPTRPTPVWTLIALAQLATLPVQEVLVQANMAAQVLTAPLAAA